MADGWAYTRCYRSEAERRDAPESWLHHYNHHRPHTACANQPPFRRLIDVPVSTPSAAKKLPLSLKIRSSDSAVDASYTTVI